ncbi:MAG: transcription termination factor Rho, partial [Clostridia bacterium]|nr:transcription termination factor Rho [Clostridia bacterium]
MQNYTLEQLNEKSIFEIRELAKECGVSSPTKSKKNELIELILKIQSGEMEPPQAPPRGRPRKDEQPEVIETVEPKRPVFIPVKPLNENTGNKPNADRVLKDKPEVANQTREGFLEINPDGYGFLRVKTGEFNEMDAYVSNQKIKQYNLRRADYVTASCRIIQEGKPASVINILTINGENAETVAKRPNFDDLTPIYPDERIRLECASKPREYATRCIDLVAPIGKGQRAMIVSPPKAGKTTLLKMIANSISENYPEIELLVLLIDERPEEVTDMQRSIKGEVIYSTFDEVPEHHTKTAEMLLDRAKRMVESGKDVVILMDSLTRLARAYNLTIPPTGRSLSGGIDPGALHAPKRFFGSARNIENGGSLTIIATAL